MTQDDEFKSEVIRALSELDTKMEMLVGNGQPGRIGHIEADIEMLKAAHNRGQGIRTAVNAAAGLGGALLGALAAAWRK